MTAKIRPVYSFVIALSTLVTTACQPPETPHSEPPLKNVQMPYGEREKPEKKPIPAPQNDGSLPAQILAILDNGDGVPLELKESCAQEICGHPSQAETPSNLLALPLDSDPEALRIYESQFHPLFAQQIASEINQRRKVLSTFETAAPRLKNVKPSKHETALMNVMWTMAHFSKVKQSLKTETSQGKSKYEWNDAKLKEELSGFSASDIKHFKVMYLDIAQSSELRLASLVSALPLKNVLEIVFPNQPVEESSKLLAANLQRSIQELKNAFPSLPFPELPSIEALAAGEDLGPDLVQNLSMAITYNYLHRVVIHEPGVFVARAIPVAATLQSFTTEGRLGSLQGELANTTALQEASIEALDTCRANIIRSYRTAPSEADIEHLKQLIQTTKALTLGNLEKMSISAEKKKEIEKAIDNLGFKFPLTQKQMLATYERMARYKLNVSMADLAAYDKYTDNDLFLSLYSDLIEKGDVLTDSLKKLCSEYAPSDLTDHVITAFGQVGVSWQTARFPKLGAGIIAHELGHVISAILKNKATAADAYTAIKSCTVARRGTNTKIDTSEEDFADWIAAKAMGSAKAQGITFDNIGCILMGNSGSRWGTSTGLSLKYPDAINERLNDPHSTAFYRLVQAQNSSLIGMPRTCQAIMDNYAPEMNRRCEAP